MIGVRVLLFGLVAVVSACATTEAPRQAFKAPVYPPPPAESRFEYDRTIFSSADVLMESKDSSFRRMITGEKRAGVPMGKPYDVAVHQGRIFVSDTQRRAVLTFDVREQKFFEIGTDSPGRLAKPLGLDVDSQGHLYVADGTQRVIQVYDRDGNHLRTLGDRSLFDRLSSVAVSPDRSRIYAVDTGGVDSDRHHILVFDGVTGEHLFNIGGRGSDKGFLNLPREIAVGGDGLIYVVDGGNFRVQAFRPDGEVADVIGGIGRQSGQFSRPKGIALDSDNNIYVSDAAFGNLQIFNPDGQLLLFIGERGASGGPGLFMLPAGLAVDQDGRIYMLDQYSRKLDIFRPSSLEPDEGYLVPTQLASER